jgi:hypothetical protein
MFVGGLAKEASGELGTFGAGQAVDIEAEFIETCASLGGTTSTRGSHDNHPWGTLDLRSDKIYQVKQALRG